jgi:hypothetical protein
MSVREGTHTDMPSAIGACKVSFFSVWPTKKKKAVIFFLINVVMTAFLGDVWY